MTMESPEHLLGHLIGRLLRLRGAIGFLENNKNNTLFNEITRVLQKFKIAQLLHDHYVIAIAGSQGAGKTTFVRLAYELDTTWLEDNLGQGERVPVLILESDRVDKPQGYLEYLSGDKEGPFSVEECLVSREEFQRAIRGQLVKSNQLLPKLLVPKRFFGGREQGFVLLPGYELESRNNREWQQLMRYSLDMSAMCLVVTDRTLLANARMKRIVEDMREHYLAGATPVVVISKTEGDFARNDTHSLEELRAAAASIFQISDAEICDRIICTGTGDTYCTKWRQQIDSALRTHAAISPQSRNRQLKRLRSVLDEDMKALLIAIRDAGSRHDHLNSADQTSFKNILQEFDSAKDGLRDRYKAKLAGALDDHAQKAVADGRLRYIEEEEGFKNWLRSAKRWVQKSSGQREDVFMDRITDSWNVGQSNLGFASRHQEMLREITFGKLALVTPKASEGRDPQKLLGYFPEADQAHTAPALSERIEKNLQVLYQPHTDLKSTEDLRKTVELIPVLALEFVRIASIFPQAVAVDAQSLKRSESQVEEFFKNVDKNFSFLKGIHSNIIRNIAIILAVDWAADGKIDTIPAFVHALGATSAGAATTAAGGAPAAAGAGTAAAGAGTAAATAAAIAAAVVAIGLLTISIINEVNRIDSANRHFIRKAILAIRDGHETHYLKHFDELMDRVREVLEWRLRDRFHIDDAFMRRERLDHACADVRSVMNDFLDAIGSAA